MRSPMGQSSVDKFKKTMSPPTKVTHGEEKKGTGLNFKYDESSKKMIIPGPSAPWLQITWIQKTWIQKTWIRLKAEANGRGSVRSRLKLRQSRLGPTHKRR